MAITEIVTSPEAPVAHADFRGMANVLTEMDTPAIRDRALLTTLETRKLEVLSDTQAYVEQHPEITDYYDAVVAHCKSTLTESELEDDEIYYEAQLFRQLFPAHPLQTDSDHPPGDTVLEEVLSIDGREFTREAALILLVELLNNQGPKSVKQLREAGLSKYIGENATDERSSVFPILRRHLKKRLIAVLGDDTAFETTGSTRAARYSLTLGQLVVSKSFEAPEVRRRSNRRQNATKPSIAVEPQSIAPTEVKPADEVTPSAPDQKLPADAASHSEQEAIPDGVVKLTIRGQEYGFTLLQKRIIDAVLEGNVSFKDLLVKLYNQTYVESDIIQHEFQPALDGLCNLVIDGQKVLRRVSETIGTRKQITFHLPPRARLEYNRRKDVTTFRFENPSTHVSPPGEGKASRRLRPVGPPAGLPHAAQPVTVPVPPSRLELDTASKPVSTPGKELKEVYILTGEQVQLPDGTKRTLELTERKILETLTLSERRMTVAEIVSALGGENDNTLNAVIAEQLAELQKILTAEVLRRKQSKGQPARWWFTEGRFVNIAPTD